MIWLRMYQYVLGAIVPTTFILMFPLMEGDNLLEVWLLAMPALVFFYVPCAIGAGYWLLWIIIGRVTLHEDALSFRYWTGRTAFLQWEEVRWIEHEWHLAYRTELGGPVFVSVYIVYRGSRGFAQLRIPLLHFSNHERLLEEIVRRSGFPADPDRHKPDGRWDETKIWLHRSDEREILGRHRSAAID